MAYIKPWDGLHTCISTLLTVWSCTITYSYMNFPWIKYCLNQCLLNIFLTVLLSFWSYAAVSKLIATQSASTFWIKEFQAMRLKRTKKVFSAYIYTQYVIIHTLLYNYIPAGPSCSKLKKLLVNETLNFQAQCTLKPCHFCQKKNKNIRTPDFICTCTIGFDESLTTAL